MRLDPDRKQLIRKNKGFIYYLHRDRFLYLLISLPVIYFIVFKYIPMYGVSIAFMKYNKFKGVFGSEWIGLDNFREVFANSTFFLVLRNTFTLNFLDLLFGFPAPIILAILLNELGSQRYKKTVQTLLYLPHFLSWVIIGGIVFQVFSPTTGLINNILLNLGLERIPFLMNGPTWVATYVVVGIWQNIGWGTIIYLAAISGINPELYEAAEVDGAGKLTKIWNITLPGIKSTIVILLILNIGRIALIGFERPFVMGNQIVRDYSEVISTFVYRLGLKSGQFSIATAIGLFQSAVSLVFLLSANAISKKVGERGLF